jgi:hypothetical protein
MKHKVNLLCVVDALDLNAPIPMRILLRAESFCERGFENFYGFPFFGITIKFRR